MNLSVDTPARYTLFQFITTVAGLAIALVSAIALGGWESESASPSSRPRLGGSLNVLPTRPADPVEEVYYLVSSEVDADRIREIERWATAAMQHIAHTELGGPLPDPRRNAHVLVIKTPLEQEQALRMISELMRDAEGVRVISVDLR